MLMDWVVIDVLMEVMGLLNVICAREILTLTSFHVLVWCTDGSKR